MATLQFTTKITGVLADVTSVVLSDPTGTYGVKRNDTDATVIAANTAMTKSATGTYTYNFASPVGGVEYTFYVKWTYGSETHYVENVFIASGDTSALTGLTFEELFAQILVNDSTSMTAGNLGQLCSYNATTKPGIIFHDFPADRIATPIITYSISAEEGHFPHNIFVEVKVWGGDIKAIHTRVYDLLHQKLEITATDWIVKGLLYDSSGPMGWDDGLKVYTQRARYRAVALRA